MGTKKQKRDFADFTPSCAEANYYWNMWKTLDRYRIAQEALDRLFGTRDEHFLDLSDLMVKCSTLNDFYSTNIYSVYRVVLKYHEFDDLGERMAKGDITLVNDLRWVPINDNKDKRDFYSFATKFCAHHNPDAFPIYDSYVDEMLRKLRNRDHKLNFRNEDLKDYAKFRNILCDFRKAYDIENLSYREVDIMLWLGGKDCFPKEYKKSKKE